MSEVSPGTRPLKLNSMTMQPSRKRAAPQAESPAIPDRLYFKIGDVARICGLETYVLRFWESQFPQLKPNKSGTGQRLYRRRDVEMVLEIKRLVHDEGYTIPGARQAMEQAAPRRNPQTALPLSADRAERRDKLAALIGQARAELREIAGLLASPDPQLPRRRSRLTAIPGPSGSLFPS
jgi:DNA-binding transcriptional MerR regulator